MKVAIAGGTPVQLAPETVGPFGFVVGSGGVYWTGLGVWQVPLDGGAVSKIAPAGAGIAVNATDVYWTGDTTVMRMPIGGGAPVTIASGLTEPAFLAIDANRAYVMDGTDGTVKTVPLTGGAPVTLTTAAPDSFSALDFAVGAAGVYWSSMTGLAQLPLGGGSTTPITAVGEPWGIATDATDVYWTNYGTGDIEKMPSGGGPMVTLASGQFNPSAIAVDATRVYWINTGDGTIRMTAK